MVAADTSVRSMVWGGLGDNNAWWGMRRGRGGGGGGGGGAGFGGALTGAEWFTVAGGDGEYAVPAPSDSAVLYVDSQNGNVTRVDLKTGVTRSIRPYLSGVQERKPADLQYRFNWTTPIEVSPSDANVVLLGGNVVFKIGVSPFDAGTAYLAVDRHQLDDRRPYVYRTTDYGKTWTDIARGLPQEVPARVVRENPNLRGFLVLGSDAALWSSRDGGATWKPLKAGFPTAPVYDLKFIKRSHDLVVATHGRGLFVLDNITTLEQLTPDVAASDFHVFGTLPAQIRVRPRRLGVAPSRFSTPNAPAGAVLDYYLKTALDTSAAQAEGGEPGGRQRRGRGIVTVTDAKGDTVVVDSSGPGKQGVNRYVWNLRYAGPTRLAFEKPSGTEEEENPFRQVGGPRAIPGTYTATLSAGGRTQTASLTVEPAPFLAGDPARFAAQLRAGLEWRNAVSALNEMLNRIVSLETQLKNVQQAVRDNVKGDSSRTAPLTRAGRDLGRRLKELKDSLYNSEVQRDAGQDDIHILNRFQERLQGLGFGMAFAYAQPPTEVVAQRMKDLRAQLDGYLARFNDLLRTDVAAFNKAALGAEAPTLVAGAPLEVKPVALK